MSIQTLRCILFIMTYTSLHLTGVVLSRCTDCLASIDNGGEMR